ncbi:type III secretion inner membrane ring lipoprotein SctJ [Vibrio sp. S4M6]|uniref:type III secretion system inner membrane ring lipoprotein SctJ n=1 Tax=Vibrio sinus TaxID=2946865 RepID=UPI00202A9F82|nr:type III secretion inner membrane ring lipoprotein SctJ [Vibrio sinus]MCL9783729.1 type III secretion inner membrane ring lipoprotein SctJ [Vibrio sinus]
MKPVRFKFKWSLLLVVLLLLGCKENLYNNLPEEEANRMLALLMLNHIQATKKVDKNGQVTLEVDKAHFINAVEILRQNGFPKRKRVDINDLFPSGQLVTSPEQEKAKMNYLKEQQLEQMLSDMDGVIDSKVSIALDKTDDTGRQKTAPSAAVLIKYSPEVNISVYRSQIKSLIRDSIPGISDTNISIMMTPATYRYSSTMARPSSVAKQSGLTSDYINLYIGIGGALVSLAGIFMLLCSRRSQRYEDR